MTAPRRLGSPTGLVPGDHVCWTFGNEAEFGAAVLPYLEEGRLRGEKLLLVGESRAALLDLVVGLPHRDRMLADGRLEIRTTTDGYAPGGALAPADQVERYRRETEDALAAGHTGLRVAADVTPLARVAGSGPADLHAYEQQADVLMADVPMTALCLYDAALGDEVLGPVALLHPGQHHGDRHPLGHLSGRGPALALHGEIDVSRAGDLHRALVDVAPQAAAGGTEVVLDLTGLTFLDVGGARALARAVRQLEQRGLRMRLVGARRSPGRVLELFGLPAVPAEEA